MRYDVSAIHPIADNVKVKLDKHNPHGFKVEGGNDSESQESGILVELPDNMFWLGFHSFAFENSFSEEGLKMLAQVRKYYEALLGKRVYWESFQDSGRRIKEGEDEYVLLKLTDIIAHSEPDVKVKTVTDIRRAGSFKA